MKKHMLEQFDKMVETHQQHAMDLCDMAGMTAEEFDELATQSTKESISPDEQPKANGGWLRKLWPF